MRMRLKTKTIWLLAIVSIALTAGSVYLCYTRYTGTMLSEYKDNAGDIAATEALLISNYDIKGMSERILEIFDQACNELGGVPDLENMSEAELATYYDRYSEITDTDEYQAMLAEVQEMNRRNNVLSLYFVAVDVNRDMCIYVVDGSDPKETVVCPCGDIAPIESDGIAKIKSKTYDFEIIDTDYPEYGWLCTAVYALLDNNEDFIGLAQVDLSLELIKLERLAFLIRLVVIMLFFSVLLTVVAAFITNKTMVHPLKELAAVTSSFVADRESEDAGKLEKLKINTGDEIEDLHKSFVGMSHELTNYIDDLMKVTAEREKMGVELDLATKIQASYLPSIFPPFPERKEFDLYATMTPAKEVGGDFYDFFLIDNDHLGLVIADVSGKGVPAALFMMISKTVVKTYSQAGGTLDPSEILRLVNDQLSETNDADMFVTVWLGILTISTGVLITANAGHEYPVIKRAGAQYELIKDKHGLPIASMEGARYKTYETTLNKGDVIFVYTDGVAEATDASNVLFGTDRMLDTLNKNTTDDCEDIIKNMKLAIDGFVKEAPQFDDITMLAFRYNGSI